MAIVRGKYAKWGGSVNSCYQAGVDTISEFEVDVSAGLLAADIVDMGALPAGAVITDAKLWADSVALGTTNVSVGFLTGKTGEALNDDGTARTVGTEIFNAQAGAALNTTLARMTGAAAMRAAPSNVNRSIGLQVSADIAAGAGKKIYLALYYTAPTP